MILSTVNCLSCGLVVTQAVEVMEDITRPSRESCQAVVSSASWGSVLMRREASPATTVKRRMVRNPVEKLNSFGNFPESNMALFFYLT